MYSFACVLIFLLYFLILIINCVCFCLPFIASRRAGALPPMENKPRSEDILNAIIPPREWIQGGK